jgi:hypothetical protein
MPDAAAHRSRKPSIVDPFAGTDCSLPRELADYLAECPVPEALKLFQLMAGTLKQRGIFRTHHFFGDYNERLVEAYFAQQRDLPALTLTAPGTWGFDATVRSGERYNLKGTTMDRIEVPNLKANRRDEPKEKAFDFFVVGHYTDDLELLRLIQIPWSSLKQGPGTRTLTIVQLEAMGELLYPKQEKGGS